MKTELLLDGLPRSFTPQGVTDLCSPYGTVLSVHLHFGPGTRPGFAYVKMASEREARAVRQALNNVELNGQRLLVIGPRGSFGGRTSNGETHEGKPRES